MDRAASAGGAASATRAPGRTSTSRRSRQTSTPVQEAGAPSWSATGNATLSTLVVIANR
ncbi:hypothetical protein [Kineococcus sp. SYSU DK018]|uniref:hypothetical protein n=1 Tax=Kineococcus sp. SYSU DK018 TaxID=3383139 RepID=UPI003D7EC170